MSIHPLIGSILDTHCGASAVVEELDALCETFRNSAEIIRKLALETEGEPKAFLDGAVAAYEGALIVCELLKRSKLQ